MLTPQRPVSDVGEPSTPTTPAKTPVSAAQTCQTPPLPLPVSDVSPPRSVLRRSVSQTERRRSVRFAGPLSPELIDKNLPACTPVKLGRTPEGRRRSMPGFVGRDLVSAVVGKQASLADGGEGVRSARRLG